MRRRVMRILLAAAVMCAIVLMPVASSTEDNETTLLAQTIYAMAGDEDYDTQLAIGSVIMNRLQSEGFPDTLEDVISQQMLPRSRDFDDKALSAARECLSGTRTLRGYVLYMKREDSGECWSSDGFFKQQGDYQFFVNM